MASEMQERMARAIFEARRGYPIPDEHWVQRVASYREIASGCPEYAKGGDGISEAFNLALAAMKAMREPTNHMVTSGGNYILDVGGIDMMHAEDRGPPFNLKGRETGSFELWMHMLDAEIAAAEER